ncbi:S8 family serine peptidase [Tsuneonella dongtanensis]|nr:S8 family serine peptidase [Tsuneonella dongtanensis]
MPISRIAMLLALLASPAVAQIGLPGVQLPTGPVRDTIGGVVRVAEPVLADAGRQLAALREDRLERLVRTNPKHLEMTPDGFPARRGEIVVFEPSEFALRGLQALGFGVVGVETIDGLDIAVTRVRLPHGVRLREVEGLLQRAAPGLQWTPDHIFEQVGRGGGAARAIVPTPAISARVGVVDGAPSASLPIAASKGFAIGAPMASDHGSAVVSLLRRAGVRTIAVADVYGQDPAGGSATAVARGLGWLVAGGAKVISMSIVGPDNPLLSRSIAAARAKGVVIVAAVGNDGPAAPPAFPASYPGVVAVTGVDARNRALIEAGRALDLDYAAPGADLVATNAKGRTVKLRGTSFAAPLAAARIAAAMDGDWQAKVDAEVVDLGRKGPDPIYGRGLICGDCR